MKVARSLFTISDNGRRKERKKGVTEKRKKKKKRTLRYSLDDEGYASKNERKKKAKEIETKGETGRHKHKKTSIVLL